MEKFNEKLNSYKSIIIFDCETNGLDANTCQIIELAATKIRLNTDGEMVIEKELDHFISLPEGEFLPRRIIELTGITDSLLKKEGIDKTSAAKKFLELSGETTLLIAHNLQFDALFLFSLLSGLNIPKFDFLDTLTIFKDRHAFPHKLSDAITAYGLNDKVTNSHRAIDDVRALTEVLKMMKEERNDIHTYINILGYNPKYGVSGKKISGIQYAVQNFNNYMVDKNSTLPALLNRRN